MKTIGRIFVDIKGNNTDKSVSVEFPDNMDNKAHLIIGGQRVKMSREQLKNFPLIYNLVYGWEDSRIEELEDSDDIDDEEEAEMLKGRKKEIAFDNYDLAIIIGDEIKEAKTTEEVAKLITNIFDELREEIKVIKEKFNKIELHRTYSVPEELKTSY